MHPKNPHRWNKPDPLKEHFATLRRLSSVSTQAPPQPSFSGSFLGSSNRPYFVVIGALALFSILLIALHLNSMNQFEEEMAILGNVISALETDRDYYRDRYEITLQDAEAFGKIQGMLLNRSKEGPVERYLTEDPAKNASATTAFFGNPAQGTSIKRLPELSPWVYYHEQGIINDDCITATKAVQSEEEIVLIKLNAKGVKTEQWPAASLLIDGTLVAKYTIGEEGNYTVKVQLPTGLHYLDILFTNPDSAGALSIPSLHVGDRIIDNSVATLDYGMDMARFDCQDIDEGYILGKEGALRIRIDKV